MNSASEQIGGIPNKEVEASDFYRELNNFTCYKKVIKNNEKLYLSEENVKSKNEMAHSINSNLLNINIIEGRTSNFDGTEDSPPERDPRSFEVNLVSPTGYSRFSQMTPALLQFFSHSYSTPKVQPDLRFGEETPNQQNIEGLNYDERSSSFTPTQNYLQKNSLLKKNLNNSEFSRKIVNDNICFTNNINNKIPKKNKNNYVPQNLSISSNEEELLSESEDRFEQQNLDRSRRYSYCEDETRSVNKKDSIYLIKLDFNRSMKKPCCTCTKTQCLKKYCRCFDNKIFCTNCECHSCLNKPKYEEKIQNLRETFRKNELVEKKNNMSCNCIRSNCTKNYCECFKAGSGCNESCRCVKCDNNKKIQTKNIIKKLSNVELEKYIAAKNPLNYKIQGISIEIQNENISVTKWTNTPGVVPHSKNVNELNEPENHFKKHLKNIFQINQINNLADFQELNETPFISSKKKKRLLSKLDSTQPPTPLNFNTTEEKFSDYKSIKIDDGIVKNLDKIYN